jgi:DNA-binding MarR family transcriptional regulator
MVAMARRATTKTDLANQAWRDIFDFIVATAGHRNKVLARLGLTPNDSRALTSLDEHTGRTLRSLADEWQCDASTATWIVDRLEARGFAQRRPHPSDRRARLVVLTPLGAQTRAELMAGSYTPPPELLELDRAELAMLREAVAKLPTARARSASRA